MRRVTMADLDRSELHGIHVLIVDDDADSRELLQLAFERSGARVTLTETANEAFNAFQNARPDVLLVDLALPDENGFGLLRRVRALPTEGEAVPAIALTGYGSPEDRAETQSSGFQAHLVKPVSLVDMLDSVIEVLQLPRSARPS